MPRCVRCAEEAAIRLALMPEAERRRLREEEERARQGAARERRRAQKAAEKAAEQEKVGALLTEGEGGSI